MPRRPDAPPLTRGVVVRGVLFVLAVALGVLGTWMLVTSGSPRNLRLGMLAGLWGLLIGCFALFGSRRSVAAQDAQHTERPAGERGDFDAERAAAERAAHQHEASARRARAEVELHKQNAVERSEDAAARRAWEHQLEQLLRSEIRESVNREVSALRAEVASLRGELLEKVGGQLRLERIETTRVIGSDLEALQEEVRKLKTFADAEEAAAFTTVMRGRAPERPPFRPVVLPAQVRPVTRQTDQVESEIQPAVQQDVPNPAEMTAPIDTAQINSAQINKAQIDDAQVDDAQVGSTQPQPQPQPRGRSAQQAPAPAPAPAPPSAAAPAPASPTLRNGIDALDGLPRITPFTDFELDPVEPENRSGSHAAEAADTAEPPEASTEASNYRGRRRRADEEPTEANGRHADRSTGRRHRADRGEHASDDDVLSRLLSDRSSR